MELTSGDNSCVTFVLPKKSSKPLLSGCLHGFEDFGKLFP